MSMLPVFVHRGLRAQGVHESIEVDIREGIQLLPQGKGVLEFTTEPLLQKVTVTRPFDNRLRSERCCQNRVAETETGDGILEAASLPHVQDPVALRGRDRVRGVVGLPKYLVHAPA